MGSREQHKKEFEERYSSLNPDSLPLDDYNKDYLSKYLEKLRYNLYLADFIIGCADNLDEVDTIIDLGGGIGFNSAYYSFLGKNVIYLDIDHESAKSAKAINESLGIENIDYVVGDLSAVSNQLDANTLLCSRDVIEHVYDLTAFFQLSSLAGRNVHFTAAILDSVFKHRYFKLIHSKAETVGFEGETIKKRDSRRAYFAQRFDMIREAYPDMAESQVNAFAKKTRGLIKEDLLKYIETGTLPKHFKATLYTNTCDPNTGNWAERCISMEDYQLFAHQQNLSFLYPKYNSFDSRGWKKWAMQTLNLFSNLPIHIIQPSFCVVY